MKYLLALLTLLAALTLSAADLTGTWKGSMDTQMGKTEMTITFTPGAATAGKVKASEYEGPIEKASRDGDKVHFEAKIGPGTLIFDGTMAGADEMKLNVTGTQGDQYTLVCKRQ